MTVRYAPLLHYSQYHDYEGVDGRGPLSLSPGSGLPKPPPWRMYPQALDFRSVCPTTGDSHLPRLSPQFLLIDLGDRGRLGRSRDRDRASPPLEEEEATQRRSSHPQLSYVPKCIVLICLALTCAEPSARRANSAPPQAGPAKVRHRQLVHHSPWPAATSHAPCSVYDWTRLLQRPLGPVLIRVCPRWAPAFAQLALSGFSDAVGRSFVSDLQTWPQALGRRRRCPIMTTCGLHAFAHARAWYAFGAAHAARSRALLDPTDAFYGPQLAP